MYILEELRPQYDIKEEAYSKKKRVDESERNSENSTATIKHINTPGEAVRELKEIEAALCALPVGVKRKQVIWPRDADEGETQKDSNLNQICLAIQRNVK